MKKYNEEYFSVIDKKTGRKICDCNDERDALMLVSFDQHNRTYIKNKLLMDRVVDIDLPKELPTNELVVVNNVKNKDFNKLLSPYQTKLPEGQQKPLDLK